MKPFRFITRALAPGLLLAAVAAPGALVAQEQDYDPEWFDCFEIWRDGSLLVMNVAGDHGLVYLSCQGKSCVSRERTTGDDGRESVAFRHVYFPKEGGRYVSTYALWTGDGAAPERLSTMTRRLSACFTMVPDDELWTKDFSEPRYEGEEIHAVNRAGDYRADYFYAPARLLGDWSGASAITFEKKSDGGYGYLAGTDFEGIYGDVVLKNGSMRATYQIPEHHTGKWREFRVPLDDPGWRLHGGATSLADILENVTMFQIRAEYALGQRNDTSAIRNVVIE